MPRIPPGIYPQARALNLVNSGRRVSVSVTLPDGGTVDVQALALNNINATACQVFVDENGNATVSNPADTGRQLSQSIGRYVHRLPSPANPVLIPQPPTGIITWWNLDWVTAGSSGAFISGTVAADPIEPDDFYVYAKINTGNTIAYFRYFAGITENPGSATLTVNATKITASASSQFGVQVYWDRSTDVYPDPTPGSYATGQVSEFFAQVPSFAFGFSPNDSNFDGSSTVSFTFSIPSGRTIIEVLEINSATAADVADPPVPSWTFSATLA